MTSLRPVAGAVLTGGASRRMGSTKALIEVDGVAMARRVADALASGGVDDIVLVGGDPANLMPVGLRVVTDLAPGEGPLGGVVTALRAHGGADVFVAACDLPRLDAVTVGAILTAARAAPSADVVVARTDRLQPGCALWRGSVTRRVAEAFEQGVRSLHGVLGSLDTVEVDVDAASLYNVNRPADLRE